uniref:Uncharacterized protein n=1 Tax=Ditylenchus dipsaci TaxID=166011 RepID=A0A915EFY8_9BILA
MDCLKSATFLFSYQYGSENCWFSGLYRWTDQLCLAPPSRLDVSSRNDFFAMCFCTLEHILLLCCYKLHYRDVMEGELSWLLVFSPLFFQSFMAMIISVWCIRHDKTFEFEMFFSINIVQFVFIAFKLDNALHWNWVIVFVPTWSCFLCSDPSTSSRPSKIPHILGYLSLILSVPLLAFFLLLSSKLDAFDWLRQHSSSRVPYIIVGSPLFMSLSFLLFLSFGSKSGNTW